MSGRTNGSGGKTTPETKIPGKESLRAPLPKRFYKSVTLAPREGGFAVLLDGKSVKTPAKNELVLPTRALAEAIAEEWRAQRKLIDPATMPLTRIANSAIDAVAGRMKEVAADILAHAGSDQICYRATAPAELAARQRKRWDPLVAWARDELGADLALAEGIRHVAQPAGALSRIRECLAGLDPFRIACLHVLTTLTGSALIALALARGRLGLEEAWAAAHVDEDWQIEQWGRDAEAEARRKGRFAEFEAASRFLGLLN